jgi:hypothetical protein
MGVSSSETTQSEEANGLASLLPKRDPMACTVSLSTHRRDARRVRIARFT